MTDQPSPLLDAATRARLLAVCRDRSDYPKAFWDFCDAADNRDTGYEAALRLIGEQAATIEGLVAYLTENHGDDDWLAIARERAKGGVKP